MSANVPTAEALPEKGRVKAKHLFAEFLKIKLFSPKTQSRIDFCDVLAAGC